ncbi:MAG TPA: Imm53 family immunity protein [Tepidisphaeraceae bacterium]|nr:Imm53 family immunity protein [Tepidisphaeraceae bacterium]
MDRVEDHATGRRRRYDWHLLSVKDSKFEGAGDPTKLAFMLRTFLDWAERQGKSPATAADRSGGVMS